MYNVLVLEYLVHSPRYSATPSRETIIHMIIFVRAMYRGKHECARACVIPLVITLFDERYHASECAPVVYKAPKGACENCRLRSLHSGGHRKTGHRYLPLPANSVLDQEEGQQINAFQRNPNDVSLRTELGTRAVAPMIISCFMWRIVLADICKYAIFRN